MQPIIPHFSSECLNLINIKDIKWPKFDENLIKEDMINLVVQINGKKRGLIKIKPDKSEKELLDIVRKDQKIFKYLGNDKIKKKIYVKNKLINIIV